MPIFTKTVLLEYFKIDIPGDHATAVKTSDR